MEKIFLGFLLFFLLGFNLYAQERPYQETGVMEIKKPAEEQLVELDLRHRIQALEQEVKDLRAANTSQNQRIRVLEHDIDSIRSAQNRMQAQRGR